MAANSLPQDPQPSSGGTWQTLVSDQRYRLFAAGSKRAAIAECLPAHFAVRKATNTGGPGNSFDARYGLQPAGPVDAAGPSADSAKDDENERLVLLTQVSRSFEPTPFRLPCGNGGRPRHPWRWKASHSVQPVSELQSYIDEQSGDLVFFLTRAKGAKRANGMQHRERLEDSAVRIGKCLGLDDDNLEALRVASLVHEISKGTSPITALGKIAPDAEAENGAGEACKAADCHLAGAVVLRSEQYCREHFIQACYERLDAYREALIQRRPSEERSHEMREFLRECLEQAADMTRNPFSQDALERARLLDILHTAADLSRRMRRSVRCAKAFDVRVRCATPGRRWEEQIRTLQVSQHGARLECTHLVRPGDWLQVERMDTGVRTRARMAWRGPAKGGHFTLGLEFLDFENFWTLSWTDA